MELVKNKPNKDIIKLIKENPKTAAGIGAGSLLVAGGTIAGVKRYKKKKEKINKHE